MLQRGSSIINKGMLPRIFASILLLTAYLLLGGCPAATEPPLRLGTNLWIGYEPFYLARERDALAADKVRLIEYPSSMPVIDAMRNGLIDAAALTLDESIALQQQVRDVRLVAVLDISAGADMLLAKPEIRNLADLRGQRVAVENLATGAYLLMRALQSAGLSTREVTIEPLSADQHEAVMLRGEVAAIVTYQPIASRLIGRGYQRLFDSGQIPGEIIDVLAVRERTLREQPRQLAYLLQSWRIGLQHLQRNRQQAIRQMMPRQRLSPEQIASVLNELQFPAPEQAAAMLKPGSTLTTAESRLRQHMLQSGLLPVGQTILPLRLDPQWLRVRSP